MTEQSIEIQSVDKRFGSKRVLDSLTLSVPRGQTFAFLGRNGAGKTTTIRMLLGLLGSDGGRISVLGLNPLRQANEIRRRVGYLGENQTMFGWMRVEEIIWFLSPFYATWDGSLVQAFIKKFELPLKSKVQHLSKGENARLGLLLALAHRPELVILDDPTLGLDPIMRKEFMRDVIDHLQGEGVTIFFSSHLLYEIEPVADQVAILERGKIILQAPTEHLRSDVRQFILSVEDYARVWPLAGALDVKSSERQVAAVLERAEDARMLLAQGGVGYEEVELNLDEIFEAYVIGNRGNHRHD